MKKNNFNISLNREKCILSVTMENFEYKEEDFDEFLISFEAMWLLIKNEKLICHLYINLENCLGNYNYPLQVYIKMASCLSDLTATFNSHCHGIAILTKEPEICTGVYNIIIKLWHPQPRRPILLTDKMSEIKLFMKSNKLII